MMRRPPPSNLAVTLLQLLKARGLSDDDALAVLGQVIAEDPAFGGKWTSQAPLPPKKGGGASLSGSRPASDCAAPCEGSAMTRTKRPG